MAAIIDRGSVRGLYVKFRDPGGKQHLVKVDGGQKKAEQRRNEIIAELVGLRQTGQLHWTSPEDRARAMQATKDRVRAEQVLVSDYAERWLEDVARLKVRARVFDGYAYALRKVWVPAIGDLELSAVSRRKINDVIADLATKGKAGATIRNMVTPLGAMFRYAVEEDQILKVNPAANIRIPTEARVRRRKVVPPTRSQVEQIIGHARNEDTKDAIRVAAATGLRRGELFGLTWQDVDFARGILHVRQTIYRATIDQTKTQAGERAVPLFDSTRKVLVARKLRTRFAGPDDFVFGTPIGTASDPGNFVRREFGRALKAAGIDSFPWHALRHFAVSALIAERADVKLLQAVAGHASAAMTLDVYGHLMTERVEEAAKLYDPMRDAV
jgi:integrase